MRNILIFALFSLISLNGQAEPIRLAEDLTRDAIDARSGNRPIVFFITADHCPYCEKLREEYFKFSPGDERFLLRELELDQHHSAIDFDGQTVDHRALANRYGISLTPTVAFVSPEGKELTEAIVGVLTMDFYHYYFEEALAESIARLKEKKLALVR